MAGLWNSRRERQWREPVQLAVPTEEARLLQAETDSESEDASNVAREAACAENTFQHEAVHVTRDVAICQEAPQRWRSGFCESPARLVVLFVAFPALLIAWSVLGSVRLANTGTGAAERAGSLPPLRSRVAEALGAVTAKDSCGATKADTDFRHVEVIYTMKDFNTAAECKLKCATDTRCEAWSWGKMPAVAGLSRHCFLSSRLPGQVPERYTRHGVVSGLKPEVPCVHGQDGSVPEPDFISAFANRHTPFCLQLGDKVEMWSCSDGGAIPRSTWTYRPAAGQIIGYNGLCLSVLQPTKEFLNPVVLACDDSPGQQWDYDEFTGIVKNWHGKCLAAGESSRNGGEVYLRACDTAQRDQQWRRLPPDAMLQLGPPPTYPVGTLYCFTLMVPDTGEEELLRMQYTSKVSLFACDAFSVYSNQDVSIGQGLQTSVIDSDLHCGKGGEFGTALNLDIFIVVWKQVIADNIFVAHEWTVKVDPDTVFFADRLRTILADHQEDPRGVYLNNCKFGMHGPLEVLSRIAVQKWATGMDSCTEHFREQCKGDCFWGEDMFLDQCLNQVLKMQRANDFRQLIEEHCEPPPGWVACTQESIAAFHPFKNVPSYMACLSSADPELGQKALQRQQAAPPAPPPPPKPLQVASPPGAA